MKRYVVPLVVLLAGAGCGSNDAPSAADDVGAAESSNAGTPPAADAAARSSNAPARDSGVAGRTEELAQPENAAIVFLYHDLAQIPPPVDQWVERDSRVMIARPAEKAAARERVRAEIEAGMRAVQRVGSLRLTLNANLSEYDPSYQEFTVGAFAPSSVFTFSAFGEKVQIKFRNARDAQTWQVPAEEAQRIRDKLGYYSANADALLRIVGVQPAPGEGVILTDVVEYDLRNQRGGQLIGRVKVTQ